MEYPNKKCPLWKKHMAKVCPDCAWQTTIRGKHPQSEQEIDQPGCAVPMLVLTGLENSQMQRQTGAAIESFRNETVKNTTETKKVVAMLGRAVLQSVPQNGTSSLPANSTPLIGSCVEQDA